jgi:hypothetical protein
MLVTTISEYNDQLNFQIDHQDRIIHTSGLNHIKDNLYQYDPDSVVFKNGNVTGLNIIVQRKLCSIDTIFTREPIEFYITTYSNTIPIGLPVVVTPHTAQLINGDLYLIHTDNVIMSYSGDLVMPGQQYSILEMTFDFLGVAQKFGFDKRGKKYHFTNPTFEMAMNGNNYYIVNKKDLLICE